MKLLIPLLISLCQDDAGLRRNAEAYAKADDADAKASLLRAGAAAIRVLQQERTEESFDRISDLLLTLKFQHAPAGALAFRDHAALRRAGFSAGSWNLDTVVWRLATYQVRRSDGKFESRNWLIYFDPAAVPDPEKLKVEIGATDLKVFAQLDHALAPHGLDYAFRYGLLLVSTPARLWPKPAPLTLTDAQKKDLSRAVADLDASDPEVRDRAAESIPTFGEHAMPLLRALSGSLEARNRAADLLKKLEAIHGEPVWDETCAADRQALVNEDRALLAAFKASAKAMPQWTRFEDARLDAVLSTMSQASGFEITAPELLADLKVTATVSELAVRDALMLICKTHGLDFTVRDGKVVVGRK
jgi:hypothetical protein